METRALAIAFFYAIGTGIGGIVGPLLFGHLIQSGDVTQLAIGFCIGAVVMAIGGIAELLFGVNAEGKSLEDIAKPLTAEDAEESGDASDAWARATGSARTASAAAGGTGRSASSVARGASRPAARPSPATTRRASSALSTRRSARSPPRCASAAS